MNGFVYVKDRNGKAFPAKVLPTTPADAKQVDDWYEPKTDGRTWYSNPKWRTWWNQKIAPQTSRKKGNPEQVFKLVVGNNLVLGVIDLIKNFPNPFGSGTITKISGIRINPECIKIDPSDQSVINEKPLFTGTGSALVTHAVVQSLFNGDRGIGLNSTLGAEGFYHNLQLSGRIAEDGYRSYFHTAPGTNFPFLQGQFGKYQNMHDQAQTTTK